MHAAIPQSLGVAKDVLEDHHPDADVKLTESGNCDFRVESSDNTITVWTTDDATFTKRDRDEITLQIEAIIQGSITEYQETADAHVFTLNTTD